MNSISKIVDEAVAAFSTLPGIGKKSALRMVLHLAQQDKKRRSITNADGGGVRKECIRQ